jgi:hypothetical protein
VFFLAQYTKLGYKKYVFAHRYHAFYLGCIWHFILILTINASQNDLKRHLKMGRICFAVMLRQTALVLVSSLPDPKKDKSSEIKLELENFKED